MRNSVVFLLPAWYNDNIIIKRVECVNGLKITDLKKSYGSGENIVSALNGISFEIRQGEFAVVLGPSGSGKSTLLNILGGMDRADSGSAEIFGKVITDYSQRKLVGYRRNDIGFVFQFYNLMPNLTARENVALARLSNGMDENEALEAVGLTKRKNNFPSQLSGGEQQRVAIARAIVKNPPLLLCDEPTGALDSKTGKKIVALLQQLKQTYGTTVIVVTHNVNLTAVADRVITLSDGKIVENKLNPDPSKAGEIEW